MPSGFLSIRGVDSIRYDINKLPNHIKINFKAVPKYFDQENLNIILDDNMGYKNFEIEFKKSNFPEYITINEQKILNNGIIKFFK
jgi:hypothetical protein